MDGTKGLIILLRKLSIQSMLARRVSKLILKVGETFGISSFHLKNFERI